MSILSDHQFTHGYTWTKAFLQSRHLLERAKKRARVVASFRGVRYRG
jgi:hypothetical protein